jgi:formate dehydrogenase iron-sulfur subunit
MPKAILYDATLCIGCLQCEEGCAKQNTLPYDEGIAAEKKTSAHKYTYVAVRDDEKFMRRLCMHCIDPSCVSACPVGALKKTKDGPVIYEEDRCMGCRYCMVACPFGVPKYEWSKALPGIRKCIMCYTRLEKGEQTACAEACPTGATISGERASLLAEAGKRISQTPGNYFNHIYGASEVGGTSVLKLSSVPFQQFGLPSKLGTQALPHLTADVIKHIPSVATVSWAMLGGIWWITNRRNQVAQVEDAGNVEKAEEKEQ